MLRRTRGVFVRRSRFPRFHRSRMSFYQFCGDDSNRGLEGFARIVVSLDEWSRRLCCRPAGRMGVVCVTATGRHENDINFFRGHHDVSARWTRFESFCDRVNACMVLYVADRSPSFVSTVLLFFACSYVRGHAHVNTSYTVLSVIFC